MLTRIDYLADRPTAASLLADWHYREWRELIPGWSFEQAVAELRTHTGRQQVPTTFVALEEDRVIGSASLLVADLDGWEGFTPWVASVYVIPTCRGRGVGRRLISRAVQEANALGISTVYLWTEGQRLYYERLGWRVMEWTACHSREVVIMRRSTADRAVAKEENDGSG